MFIKQSEVRRRNVKCSEMDGKPSMGCRGCDLHFFSIYHFSLGFIRLMEIEERLDIRAMCKSAVALHLLQFFCLIVTPAAL